MCIRDSFSPEDRENLLKGMPDEGRRMADAMYERMLFGNKAYKELFRALEAVWAEHAEEIAADPARKDFYLGVFGVHPESACLLYTSRCV